ncbi:acyl-CoA oxidase [Aspergillus steynii IBT 23096]|uniref:Acyl-CoA oxidase n=1 Tax=Aspergillus steynii IBT 23096 TaxID=1392250 RepID=A0A2I2FSZ9_9EURO|nr:acyl-CoA oxidase [Aspergillus steynii IBT 23096]PLB43760.1 acyl-CoA oxidase [Aspergillus steynii IBT 23096]
MTSTLQEQDEPAPEEPSSLYLLSTALFQHHYEDAPRIEHLERSYLRAQALGRHHGLAMHDIIALSPRFWQVHKDYMAFRDTVAQIIVMVQINIVAGTVALYAAVRPDLHPLMENILNFDVIGSFMLTELDHGCDARNIETTATLQSDGSFDLHTPHPGASKFMPPSMPVANIPRLGIVFARLIVRNEDLGMRAFIVPLADKAHMRPGVQSKLLPPASGGRMLDYSLTSFNHVRIPGPSMLGDFTKPTNMRTSYLSTIQRIGTGTLALNIWIATFLKGAVYIAGKYSLSRTVQQGLHGERTPIMSFRTQHLPILHALAHIAVLEPFADWVEDHYVDESLHPEVRHGLGAILKAMSLQVGQGSLANLSERIGARGAFIHNQIREMEALARFCGIAEGDLLVLSIRLATEIPIDRYSLPEPRHPDCLLARHETGLLFELREAIHRIPHPSHTHDPDHSNIGFHRSDAYNKHILPRCRPLVLAIAHRMAYEAALDASIDPNLLALFEAEMIQTDPAWYTEHLGLSRSTQADMEERAIDALFPRIRELVDRHDAVEPYLTAPMMSSARWDAFQASLPTFDGRGGARL